LGIIFGDSGLQAIIREGNNLQIEQQIITYPQYVMAFSSPPATARMNSLYLSQSSQLISSRLSICLMQPLLAEGPLELPKSLHGASTAQDRRATDSYHLRGGGIFFSSVSTHSQCFAPPSITLGNNRDACDALCMQYLRLN
jgi:hypothetical protein